MPIPTAKLTSQRGPISVLRSTPSILRRPQQCLYLHLWPWNPNQRLKLWWMVTLWTPHLQVLLVTGVSLTNLHLCSRHLEIIWTRPFSSLDVSHVLNSLDNKPVIFGLNWSIKLQENNGKKTPLLHRIVGFQMPEKGFTHKACLRFKFGVQNYLFL